MRHVYNSKWAQTILDNTSRKHVIELLGWWREHGIRVHGLTIGMEAIESLKSVLKIGVKK